LWPGVSDEHLESKARSLAGLVEKRKYDLNRFV
jgi:hypothetical protein